MKTKRWLPIRYREFYDIPRIFVVEASGDRYLFDCPFDPDLDDYPEQYRVYRLPGDTVIPEAGSWNQLAEKGCLLGEIPTSLVAFDQTTRAFVEARVLDHILGQ